MVNVMTRYQWSKIGMLYYEDFPSFALGKYA